MNWSPQQQGALDAVKQWMELEAGDDQVFYLAGYAGTGKSTLARHFAEGVEGYVMFGAYTGKAALVMRRMGCVDATTVHRMIYVPRERSTARFSRMKKDMLLLEEAEQVDEVALRKLRYALSVELMKAKGIDFDLRDDEDLEIHHAALVVVDEVSMVGEQMGGDLLSFGRPILVLGDPAQLPPVKGGGYFTAREPDVMLTEIHRQAEGSPVIDLATAVREGRRPGYGIYGESAILQKGVLGIQDVLEFDQVLVGRNVTRKALNARIREEMGRTSHLPMAGDRLVCLRNNHDLGLLNGAIWDATSDAVVVDDDTVLLEVKDPDNGQELAVLAHRHYFEDREDDLVGWITREAECFDFGYVLTVHKSQGSQWDRVLVLDESRVFRGDAKRWLYTGITRAAEAVTVVDVNGYVSFDNVLKEEAPKADEVPW